MLLVAPGLTTSNKKLLGTKGIATRSSPKILSQPCLSQGCLPQRGQEGLF